MLFRFSDASMSCTFRMRMLSCQFSLFSHWSTLRLRYWYWLGRGGCQIRCKRSRSSYEVGETPLHLPGLIHAALRLSDLRVEPVHAVVPYLLGARGQA
jgi:hypothetical protein